MKRRIGLKTIKTLMELVAEETHSKHQIHNKSSGLWTDFFTFSALVDFLRFCCLLLALSPRDIFFCVSFMNDLMNNFIMYLIDRKF